jgi:nucleotide-binding universal stress UspA family protein
MYRRVVVAIDGSEISDLALDAAIALCLEVGALLQPLFVVFVPVIAFEIEVYDPRLVRDAIIEEGRRTLERASHRMRGSNLNGEPRIVEAMAFEDVAQEIIACASEFNADLLVLGTHGRKGFKRLMLGSVAEHTLRMSRIPVLLVPPRSAVPELGLKKSKTLDVEFSRNQSSDAAKVAPAGSRRTI